MRLDASRIAVLAPVLALCVLCATASTLAGSAPTHPLNLAGRWLLDIEASDPVGPLLGLFGVDRASRAIAERTAVTQVITQVENRITIDFSSRWRNTKRTIPVDGSLAPDVDPAGRPSSSRSTWGEERSSVVSRSRVTLADGTKVEFVVERTRPAPDRMVVTSSLTPTGGELLTVRRVFARVPHQP